MEDIAQLRAAYDKVKEFPEFSPNERVYWLELRRAVELVLEKREA